VAVGVIVGVTGVVGDILIIISRGGGAFLSRWAHVVVGITWIGLLYYFNFVQVPAFAEMEAAARNNAMDKLTWRALWWFRWSAVLTVLTGLSILIFENNGKSKLTSGDFWKSAEGVAIATGILLALIMFANVWGVIWRKQKIVIANARNVQAGGEADPNAAVAARKSALASRQNTIYSLPMLVFMVGTSHFPYDVGIDTSGSKRTAFWIVWIVVWGLFELNALGVFGTSPGSSRVIYDTHRNAIITSFVYSAVALILFSYILTS